MNEQELVQFVEWLPANIKEFKDKTPEEVVTILNKMSQTEEGINTISGLINQFKQSSQMFKKGGKIDILINKFQNGGKSSQRPSDIKLKEFHGINLFDYSPNKFRAQGNVSIDRNLKSGTNKTTLKNGVGLRQITRNNITTSELVSPDKRDTLYIHNGIGGRVDSNIDDSGILGKLGLKQSTPVSNRFRELQENFNTQKFNKGKKINPIKRDSLFVDNTIEPGQNNFRDRRLEIITTLPDNTSEVKSIDRIISNDFRDTSYYQTLQRLLPNGNPIGGVIVEQIEPSKEVKNKMK